MPQQISSLDVQCRELTVDPEQKFPSGMPCSEADELLRKLRDHLPAEEWLADRIWLRVLSHPFGEVQAQGGPWSFALRLLEQERMKAAGRSEDPSESETERFMATALLRFRVTYGRPPNQRQIAQMQALVNELAEEKRRVGKDPFREIFYMLMELTSSRLQIPLEQFPDPYRLGCDLAGAARSFAELEVAKMLACRGFPGGPNFKRFMQKYYVPKLDQLFGTRIRACQECFVIFLPTDRRGMYCSPRCKDRHSKHGRTRKGSGRAAADELRAHFERGCPECNANEPCATRERLMARDDMYSRRRSKVSPDVLEQITAQRGPRLKRKA